MVKRRRRRPHFKSREAYRKWLAYIHIHGIKGKGGGVYIRGKYHRPRHSRSSRRSRRTTTRHRSRRSRGSQGRRRGRR